ncbi:MAG: GNAT family N-acetyltransferase [Clostridiaceae bacterium]|nr:GNAT family N-acetyltransferase [Clostridiaceae bacterium]
MEKGFYIKQSNNEMQLRVISDLLSKSYWAKDRSTETIKKSIENSICYGVFLKKDNKQVGFARVITDYSTMYYICDVIISEDYRGKGMGKALVDFIVNDTRLQGISGKLLTKDAHSLYEKFGFNKVEGKYMARE